MRPTSEQFRAAWPRAVRVVAAWSGSLDAAEDHVAEAMARAVEHDDVEDLTAWCVRVAKRSLIDERRRAEVLTRITPDLARAEVAATVTDDRDGPDAGTLPDGLDDRTALLFVACDPALSPGAQLVLALRVVCGLPLREVARHLGLTETTAAARLTRAKRSLARARGSFQVPDAAERLERLPVVADCVAGLFTVAHRAGFDPPDALADTGSQALSLADALVALHPGSTELRGLRAVVRLGLARRPGRVDADGVALTLAEVDRSRWDTRLVRLGLADATSAAAGDGRFALEAAISGLHTVAPSSELTDWPRIVQLYGALEQVWPSPAVTVARLAARLAAQLADRPLPADAAVVAEVEAALVSLAADGPGYARRDAAYALADLCWRTGRGPEAAARYRALAQQADGEPVRRFCERRAAQAERIGPPPRP
ncbi:RNA polymerase sigma-70 factor, ECF subfamily [Nocardioides scoriae]|uniref:RNA polymerase sigma-70 factor, ECF subfamily n=1 Tax=Nocardioides scoriae TaxID=642780 RepID=A0A1H1Q2A4_9ACTN|nr:sigma-70 family RNA polymerase sigma factor [Nocardioides scoriae]SDS17622.1 RNA polymerase sigma-70 factor, ECF subfamily [Nocardioides scoriae]